MMVISCVHLQDGETPLMVASFDGDMEMVSCLLDGGAETEQENNFVRD